MSSFRHWGAGTLLVLALVPAISTSATAQTVIGNGTRPAVEVDNSVLDHLGAAPTLPEMFLGKPTASSASSTPLMSATAPIALRAPASSRPIILRRIEHRPQHVRVAAHRSVVKKLATKAVAAAPVHRPVKTVPPAIGKKQAVSAPALPPVAIPTPAPAPKTEAPAAVDTQTGSLPVTPPAVPAQDTTASLPKVTLPVIAPPTAAPPAKTTEAPADDGRKTEESQKTAQEDPAPFSAAILAQTMPPSPLAIEKTVPKSDSVSSSPAAPRPEASSTTPPVEATPTTSKPAMDTTMPALSAPMSLTTAPAQAKDPVKEAAPVKDVSRDTPKPEKAPPPAATPQEAHLLPPPSGSTSAVNLAEPPSTILFEKDGARLPDETRTSLTQLADRLTNDATLQIQLLAYAEGDEENSSKARRLSLSRALTVRSYLIDQGVRSTRIEVRALGNKVPDGPADRVDILVQKR